MAFGSAWEKDVDAVLGVTQVAPPSMEILTMLALLEEGYTLRDEMCVSRSAPEKKGELSSLRFLRILLSSVKAMMEDRT